MKLLFLLVNIISIRLQRIIVYFLLKREQVKYKSLKSFYGKPFILNHGTFIIEENVTINSRYANNPIGGQTFSSFWIKPGGKITIDAGAKISNSAFVSAKEIFIGKNVYIGGDCKIYDTDFHSLEYRNRSKLVDEGIKSIPVIIEDKAFIGGGTIILKGVRIGTEAVIGAGSVVTRNVPPKEVWAGNPAKFIKKLQ